MPNDVNRRFARFALACSIVGSHAWSTASSQGAAAVRFAVMGDSGTGDAAQYDVANVMATTRARTPFQFVLMLGDNLYGGWSSSAIVKKFEQPYKPLLDAGVQFYASLGNHDDAREKFYPAFHMNGERYYKVSRGDVDFFALDSNYMDRTQLVWIDQALHESSARWKVAFFHHPLYSSASRHGSEKDLRVLLEPLLIRHGVQVVFSGHDHVYERVTSQQGITYFVCGSSGQLRRGDLDKRSSVTAAGFDQDRTFMVVEMNDDTMQFQAVSRSGRVIDAGEIPWAARDRR